MGSFISLFISATIKDKNNSIELTNINNNKKYTIIDKEPEIINISPCHSAIL